MIAYLLGLVIYLHKWYLDELETSIVRSSLVVKIDK